MNLDGHSDFAREFAAELFARYPDWEACLSPGAFVSAGRPALVILIQSPLSERPSLPLRLEVSSRVMGNGAQEERILVQWPDGKSKMMQFDGPPSLLAPSAIPNAIEAIQEITTDRYLWIETEEIFPPGAHAKLSFSDPKECIECSNGILKTGRLVHSVNSDVILRFAVESVMPGSQLRVTVNSWNGTRDRILEKPDADK